MMALFLFLLALVVAFVVGLLAGVFLTNKSITEDQAQAEQSQRIHAARKPQREDGKSLL